MIVFGLLLPWSVSDVDIAPIPAIASAIVLFIALESLKCFFCDHPSLYTPSQRGNYHHSMFHNPTAAVNLFHVGNSIWRSAKPKPL